MNDFVFPLFFSAGSLGYAIHLLFPIIPLDVAMIGIMSGIGGAVMRMPFTVMVVMKITSSRPSTLPCTLSRCLLNQRVPKASKRL